jgi:hypothetical protein
MTGLLVAGQAVGANEAPAKHVLLISVDGLHQTDLAWYVRTHPSSALAILVRDGTQFTHAQTPVPSDSFPGMVAQVTGGNPSSTGIFYDDSYNHALLPAGTTSCAGVAPGVEVTYFEAAALNPHSIDSGQGLSGLPGSILQLTGNATSLIDPAQLPVDPKTCTPVYPHQYIKVNTVFEVARAAGLRTAWSDKHAAYEVLNGPSGVGIQDLFTPEINSDAPVLGSPNDWTKDNALTQQYDSYKVQAVINEINGFDHSGTHSVGTPRDLRDELPDRLHRAKAAGVERIHRRLPRRRCDARSASGARARLHQHQRRGHGRGDQGPPPRPQHSDHPVGQARAVAADAVGADAHPGRTHHGCARRRVGGRQSHREGPTGRLLDQ